MGANLYLAQQRRFGRVYYFIRESVWEGGLWRSRDLVFLGEDPSRFIIYPGGNSFYIDEDILEALERKGIKTDQWALEKIFWRFVDPEIRRVVQDFSAHKPLPKRERLSYEQQIKLQEGFHPFDKRRLIFLKFGSTHIEGLLRRPLPFLNILQEKSRDEIEQLIMDMETKLRPKEVLAYVYTAFGLARHFAPRLTRFVPEAQMLAQIDQFFLQELCSLLEDPSYLMGLSPHEVLRDYLSRYVILHFDRLEAQRRFFSQHEAKLLRQKQAHLGDIITKAARYFGVSEQRLWRMGKEDITRLFRQRAQELHPDKGGDHEAFIRLRKLFEDLMAARGWRRFKS